MKQFSTDDLLLDLYHENDADTAAALDEAVAGNWSLHEKKAVLTEAMDVLQSGWQHPRAELIASLLAYAGKNVAEPQA